MDTYFHPTLYNGCNYLLIHVEMTVIFFPFIFLNVAYWSPRSVKEKCKQYISNSDPIIIRITYSLGSYVKAMRALNILGMYSRDICWVLGMLHSFDPRTLFRSLNKCKVSTTTPFAKSNGRFFHTRKSTWCPYPICTILVDLWKCVGGHFLGKYIDCWH